MKNRIPRKKKKANKRAVKKFVDSMFSQVCKALGIPESISKTPIPKEYSRTRNISIAQDQKDKDAWRTSFAFPKDWAIPPVFSNAKETPHIDTLK